MSSGINWIYELEIDVSRNNDNSTRLIPGWSWADYNEPKLVFMASGSRDEFDPVKVPATIKISGQVYPVQNVNEGWLK